MAWLLPRFVTQRPLLVRDGDDRAATDYRRARTVTW
jgi:hypothetical protein